METLTGSLLKGLLMQDYNFSGICQALWVAGISLIWTLFFCGLAGLEYTLFSTSFLIHGYCLFIEIGLDVLIMMNQYFVISGKL